MSTLQEDVSLQRYIAYYRGYPVFHFVPHNSPTCDLHCICNLLEVLSVSLGP